MNDVHGLKPLMSVDFPWLPFIATLLLMTGTLVLGGWLLWRLLRRRRPEAQPSPAPEPVYEPQQVRQLALQALQTLESSLWLRQEQAQPFYLELEGIFKRYLEGIYRQPVTSLTDQELCAFLHSQQMNPASAEALEKLLQRSLMARFARQPLSGAQMREDLAWIRNYVQQEPA